MSSFLNFSSLVTKIEDNPVIQTAMGSAYRERAEEQVFCTAVKEIGATEQRFVS